MKQFILLVLILFTVDASSQDKRKNSVAENYKTSKFDVAIFPRTYIDLIPGKRFTPTKLQIDDAETNLTDQIKNLNRALINQTSGPIIHKRLRNYKRQYFGYTNEQGERILLINCFWTKKKDKLKNWLDHRISVLDGGSYYWEVKYNIEKKKIFDLDINGHG